MRRVIPLQAETISKTAGPRADLAHAAGGHKEMRMKPWIPLLLAAVLTSGCSGIGLGLGGGHVSSAEAWTHWVCDTQASVQWHYVDAAQTRVDARLAPSDQVYHLRAEPGGDGQLFSDGVLALHVQGSTGLVYWVATNDLIGRGCKAP